MSTDLQRKRIRQRELEDLAIDTLAPGRTTSGNELPQARVQTSAVGQALSGERFSHLFFDTAPLPWQQARLPVGLATGYHRAHSVLNRNVLDTSDAVRLAIPVEHLIRMIQGYNRGGERVGWSDAWWGGKSSGEILADTADKIRFDFVPDRFVGEDGTPKARLYIELDKEPTTTRIGDITVHTFVATLYPRTGENPGDHTGAINNTGDIATEMRVHAVDFGDGTSALQLDWKGALVEPEPEIFGGKAIGRAINPSFRNRSRVINVANLLLIDEVGRGHNNTLRPKPGADSGFAYAARLYGAAYEGNVDFDVIHPDIARRVKAGG